MIYRQQHWSFLQLLALGLCAMMVMPALYASAQVAPAPSASDSYNEPVIFDLRSPSGAVESISSEQKISAVSSGVSILANANVQVVKDSGSSANRVDLVFLGDGYTSAQLGTYAARVSQLSNSMLLQTPLYEYSNYFNIHRVDSISAEGGVDGDPSQGTLRNTALDSQFWCQGVEGTLCTNVTKALEYAALARAADQVVVLVNSAKIGSAAYPFSDLAVVSSDQSDAANSLVHEFGHSFANLADESDAGVWPNYTGFEPAEPNSSAQNAAAMTAQGIKWFRWLGTDLGSNYGGPVGTYEGAMGHLYGIYRPTTNSKMRTITAPFNLPSIEAAIEQIYRLVSPIDNATPSNAALTGLSTLFVTPLQPLDHSLSVQWYINGSPVSGATGTTFHPNDFPLADGTYSVSVKVIDQTPFVRDEAFRSQYMTASRSWSVAVDQNPPVLTAQPADKTVYVGQTASFTVGASGDELHYQWYKDGAAIAGATGASYTTPPAVKGDNAAQYWVIISNIAGSITSRHALLMVPNRPPVLGAIAAQSMVRSQTKSVPLSFSDPDGDALSLSAALTSGSASSGASVSIQSNALVIQTNSSFVGTFSIVVTLSDGTVPISQTAQVTVSNQIPTISPIAGQSMNWKADSLSVAVSAADGDGEPLNYSAQVTSSNPPATSLSFSGSTLTVNPPDNYQGTFTVRVTVTDGAASASASFPVTVYNSPPTLAAIANQTMFWKADSIQVTMSGYDGDGDSLTYSAYVIPGGPSTVVLSVAGNKLTIDPPSNYQGSFLVAARVSDGDQYAERQFWVFVTNSGPTLQLIPDQTIHWKTDSLTIPLTASDPDGDTVTLAAAITGGVSVPVTLTLTGSNLKIDPDPDYLGVFYVTVTASDGNLTTPRTFKVEVYNKPPILAVIPDQRLHYIKDPDRTLTIAADPQDADSLTMTAEVLGNVSPAPQLSVQGMELKIDPADRFLGKFSVRVVVTDGKLYDSKTFLVTTYNTAPDLQPICDRAIPWNALPYAIALNAADTDGEDLTYSAEVEEYLLPYQLDQAHNFSELPGGWNYNLTGLNEKYLRGDENSPGTDNWYMILPSGELYRFGGSVAASQLVARLPQAYYLDPTLLFDVPAHYGALPAVNITDASLSISADQQFRGSFLVRARAADEQLFDEEPFVVTIYDAPLRLSGISAVHMHWTEDSRTLPLSVIDPDGAAAGGGVAYSAAVASGSAANSLDAVHDFNQTLSRTAYTADNAAGSGEKYILGTRNGGSNYLYAILPNGELYSISGAISGSTVKNGSLISKLDPAYYADPTLLIDAPPDAATPVSISIDSSNNLMIDPQAGFVGKLLVGVDASGGGRFDHQTVIVDVYNSSPLISKLAPATGYPVVTVSYKQDSVVMPLAASDADPQDLAGLTFSGRVGSPAWMLYDLYQYGLSIPSGGVRYNQSGWREKHLNGTYLGAADDFAVLPGNNLYRWRGSVGASQLIARLHTGAYQNPASIINSPQPGAADPRPAVTVSVSGSNLIIDPPANYIGTFWGYAGVTDGERSDYTLVQVQSVNFPPAMAPVADRTVNWRSATTVFTLPGSDPDGDNLTYGAALTATAPAALSVSGNQLTVTPQSGYLGDISIRATVTDGTSTDARAFKLTVTDGAPSVGTIGDQVIGYKDQFTVAVNSSDPDGDPLTLSAAAVSGASLVNVSLTGNTLKVTPKSSAAGTARITITASDGLKSAQSSFNITFQNRSPVLAAVPAQTIHWKEGARTLVLSATDPDNDTITYSAAVTNNPSAATVGVSGKNLTFTLKSFSNTFFITAYASDGTNTASQTFRVDMLNSAPSIAVIPAQTMHWRTPSKTVTLQISDADGDAPTVSAKLSSGSSHPVTFSAASSSLTMNFSQQKVGSFYVDVTAKDALVSTTTTFKVTVDNGKPEIDRIPDQMLAEGQGSVEVSVDADDPDEDPLTYSAQVLSATELTYELDQIYNFDLLSADYYYNKLGNKEKYIKGTKAPDTAVLTFVIYPDGKLYQWSGQLTTSRYIATLPTDYYIAPNLLFNVVRPGSAAAPATLSYNGNLLRVLLTSGYSGKFWVKTSVSDTQDRTDAYFGVFAGISGGVYDDPADACDTTIKTRSGSYSCGGTTAFVAQGRIGDTLLSDHNQTYELSLSKSSTGNLGANESANYRWTNSKKTSFSLSYNSNSKTAQLTIDGTTVTHVTDFSGMLTDIMIRANANLDNAGVTIDQLKLNGASVAGSVSTSQCSSSANVLQITAPGQLVGDFTLTGVATLTFSSTSSRKIKNSELAFQISLADIQSHEGYCGESGGGKKVTICHIPPGNSANAQTIKVSLSALEAHLAHGDIIGECPGNPSDPGDGGGSCEQKTIITSPNYTLWNSFLGMTDILELTNPTTADLPVTISFYSILGQLKHQVTVNVPAVNQFDVIVNDFPGFVKDSYGVIKLEFSGPLDGRMMYYRPSADGAGYDFAFDQPLNDASFGTTAVGFNTFQPSLKDDERNNLVANWLSVVNLDSAAQGYTIDTYDNLGSLILRRQIEVPAFGRADIDGGHDLAGPNVVGVHIIRPNSVTAEYIALVTRFGGNAPRGYVSSKYKFAFPLAAKLGQSDPIYMPISRKFNEYNWIEVVNILDKEVGASVNYYASDGRLLESVDANLPAHAQQHFNASANLAEGETGYAVVVPREPYSIIAQSMGYLREPATGSVTAVYGSQARRALPCLQSGSYNLYLTMQNWLLVANTTNDSIEATVHLTGPNLQSDKTLVLAPRASVYLPIHDPAQFGAKVNSYGLISVTPKDSSLRLFAEVMRVRFRANGMPDFAAPTPIR